MYDLIDFSPTLNRPTLTDLTLVRHVKQQYTAIERVVDFYHTYVVNGPSDSPFIRLLYDNTWDIAIAPYLYYSRYGRDDILPAYGFTGETHKGKVHTGFFYGDAKTIILADNNSTLATVMRNPIWQTLEPITVLKHPGTTHSLVRPDLAYFDSGIAVVSVDLPMLGFMYGSWIKDQAKLDPTQRERPEQFLVKYVYPNMLYSQFRAVAINTLAIDISDLGKFTPNPTPLLVTDKTEECFYGYRDLLARFNGEATFDQLLTAMPDIDKDNLFIDRYVPVSVVENNYTDWAVVTAAMPLLVGLTAFSINNPTLDLIRGTYNRYRRRIRMQGTIAKIGDEDIQDYLKDGLDILDMYFM